MSELFRVDEKGTRPARHIADDAVVARLRRYVDCLSSYTKVSRAERQVKEKRSVGFCCSSTMPAVRKAAHERMQGEKFEVARGTHLCYRQQDQRSQAHPLKVNGKASEAIFPSLNASPSTRRKPATLHQAVRRAYGLTTGLLILVGPNAELIASRQCMPDCPSVHKAPLFDQLGETRIRTKRLDVWVAPNIPNPVVSGIGSI
jgi:hypothetical protein